MPGIKAFSDLVNPHAEYKETKNREVYLHPLEVRKRFELPHKGITNVGVERRMCLVRANGTSLACPLVLRSKESSTSKVQIPLAVKEVPSKEQAPKVCRQTSVTINNTAADGAKLSQDGPAYKNPEWEEVYGQRNSIESRDDKLTNARGVGIGDQTNRLMRGWAGQLLASAVSCVAVNVLLLASDCEWFEHEPGEPKRHTTRYIQDRAAARIRWPARSRMRCQWPHNPSDCKVFAEESLSIQKSCSKTLKPWNWSQKTDSAAYFIGKATKF